MWIRYSTQSLPFLSVLTPPLSVSLLARPLHCALSSVLPPCLSPVKASSVVDTRLLRLLTPYLPGHWLYSPFALLVGPIGVRSLLVMKQNEQWVSGQQLVEGFATRQLHGLGQVTTLLDLMLLNCKMKI